MNQNSYIQEHLSHSLQSNPPLHSFSMSYPTFTLSMPFSLALWKIQFPFHIRIVECIRWVFSQWRCRWRIHWNRCRCWWSCWRSIQYDYDIFWILFRLLWDWMVERGSLTFCHRASGNKKYMMKIFILSYFSNFEFRISNFEFHIYISYISYIIYWNYIYKK